MIGSSVVVGCAPNLWQDVEFVQKVEKEDVDIQQLKKVTERSYEQYCKTRRAPSKRSVERAKTILRNRDIFTQIHPELLDYGLAHEQERQILLKELQTIRPRTTALEHNGRSSRKGGVLPEHVVSKMHQFVQRNHKGVAEKGKRIFFLREYNSLYKT